jgi:hypothetical protein
MTICTTVAALTLLAATPPESQNLAHHFAECVPRAGSYVTVKVVDLRGEPEAGPRGDGQRMSVDVVIKPDGSRGHADGTVPFRPGEAVKIVDVTERPGDGAGLVEVVSLFKHNITRGLAAMQHESPEKLRLFLIFQRPDEEKPFDCGMVGTAWSTLFSPLDAAAVQRMLSANPSGVLVDEVKVGMTPAEVEAILGPPERKADLTTKTIYFYPRMKITFVAGKVADVE